MEFILVGLFQTACISAPFVHLIGYLCGPYSHHCHYPDWVPSSRSCVLVSQLLIPLRCLLVYSSIPMVLVNCFKDIPTTPYSGCLFQMMTSLYLGVMECFLLAVIASVQFSHSVMSDCDPMDCSMPDFPVHHQYAELAQTHVHWVGDAIQSSHPLSTPSPPAFNLSSARIFSNESVLPSGGQSIGVWASTSVTPMNIQDWFPLWLSGLISLQSRELSPVFSSTSVWKHQFFSAKPSLWSSSHIHTWLLEKP